MTMTPPVQSASGNASQQLNELTPGTVTRRLAQTFGIQVLVPRRFEYVRVPTPGSTPGPLKRGRGRPRRNQFPDRHTRSGTSFGPYGMDHVVITPPGLTLGPNVDPVAAAALETLKRMSNGNQALINCLIKISKMKEIHQQPDNDNSAACA